MKIGTKTTMTMKKSIYFATVLLALAGCTRNQEIDVPDANLSLFATTESPAESRTIVESGVHVYWEPGDEIAVFMGEKSAKFTTDITTASGTATFKGTFGDSEWPEEPDLWAVYPFSEDATFDGETITTTLPSTQVAREGSFGKDMNLSIAHSTGTAIQFYNVGGGIRFSVLEEGIKKVMFEGLSGEIISGKVKIGFDGNGTPMVQEVSGGSQFITLLPPVGKEAFEPGVWYYIVAIPGALNGGYKLRFYKDSDYARKVSEKAVEIKRSVYGSLEKADSGIEYEATTTHYPETEEEWAETEQRIHYIGGLVFDIVNSRDKKTREQIREDLLSIDGVLNAFVNEDNGAISILQKDSLWLFYLPYSFDYEPEGLQISQNNVSSQRTYSKNKKRKISDDNSTIGSSTNANSLAVILSPYFEEDTDEIKKHLLNAGFQENNIDVKKGIEANILLFKGSNLAKYKFVYIHTHGATFHYTDPDDLEGTSVLDQTTFLTGTPFSKVLTYGLQKEQIAVAYHDIGDYRFCMIPSLINNTDFSTYKPFVFLEACESAKIENNLNGRGSMVGTLITNHASAIAGFSKPVPHSVSSYFAKYVLEFMSSGFSFQQASRYWKESEMINRYCKSAQFYHRNPSIWSSEDKVIFGKLSDEEFEQRINGYDTEVYKYYPISPNSGEYYLVNPYPQLINSPIVNNNYSVVFSWECELKSFNDEISFTEYKEGICSLYSKSIECSVQYDLFVDDQYKTTTYGDDESAKTAIVSDLQADEHSWYVIGKLIIDGKVEASYKSEVKKFTVEGKLQPIDLGLSVKWANMNLGANKQEDYGDFFAWGETEPYYSNLNPLSWKEGKEEGYFWTTYKWGVNTYQNLTKYCTNSEYGYEGFVDGKTVLDPEDDAAHVILGDKWRMPTKEEQDDLISKCTWEYVSMNGIPGKKVTASNGNWIFLPGGGDWEYTGHYHVGDYGLYWSSTIYPDAPYNAYRIGFLTYNSGDWSLNYRYERWYGFSIRPVYDEK